jgi:MFS family permease
MAALVFLAFALAYFFSALVRAITATLSPVLTQELGLQASDLGLLAGGYFLGFSLTQLPLGRWLDRHGPRRVILAFLSVGVLGCIAFSQADSFAGLLMARVLCGVGLSACLMAPLTGYRRWFDANVQLRTNSWMLMTGSLGMVAATLPVQWLLPIWGWRPLFVAMAVCMVLSMLAIRWWVPEWQRPAPAITAASADDGGYGAVWRSRYFWRMTPLGFFSYGGMVAIQTLWAGPWMTQVAGWTALEAATGLFMVNLSMLVSFSIWGWVTPALARRGLHADQLISWGLPLSLLAMVALVFTGPAAGGGAAVLLAAYCVSSTSVALSQSAVGMAFAPHLAGRALSAYNLVIFAGIFVVQWGIGLGVDLARDCGLDTAQAYQAAFAAFGVCSLFAWLFFLLLRADNRN